MSVAVELQRAAIARLEADVGVVALVPANDVSDRHGLPTASPSIILGEDVVYRDPVALADDTVRVAMTVHVWVGGTNFTLAKRIGGAIETAFAAPLTGLQVCEVLWLQFETARWLRDPSGDWAHGVLTFEAMIRRGSPS